jgi:hypothetical protein
MEVEFEPFLALKDRPMCLHPRGVAKFPVDDDLHLLPTVLKFADKFVKDAPSTAIN